MNLDINQALSHIQKYGISSVMAILFCIYIADQLNDLEDKVSQQAIELENIVTRVEQIESEQAAIWNNYDDALKEKGHFESDLKVLQERINELQRHY